MGTNGLLHDGAAVALGIEHHILTAQIRIGEGKNFDHPGGHKKVLVPAEIAEIIEGCFEKNPVANVRNTGIIKKQEMYTKDSAARSGFHFISDKRFDELVIPAKKRGAISEVLEELHHFEQNRIGLNDDKPEPLRTLLNEIDAKQHLIDNAARLQIPRKEVDHLRKQLDGYEQQLEEYMEGR